MYLKRTHFSWRIQIDKEKIGFCWRNWKKIRFSNFCLKNEGDQVSSRVDFAKLYQQISKMTLSGSGRSFNLKSLQRRALYLCSFGIGRRSPERWATVAPPTWIGLKWEMSFRKRSTLLHKSLKNGSSIHTPNFDDLPFLSKFTQETTLYVFWKPWVVGIGIWSENGSFWVLGGVRPILVKVVLF